ncbi:MAG: TonB-dependent receptor plug domain-containing protein [Bacteroidetes bacterium]|nr:TonB-dependent receptor plug domain-containing protein [Bacteroidota bacterium]
MLGSLLGGVPSLAQDDGSAADPARISGYVRDAETGETLLLANVVALSGDVTRGAATNNAGYYTIAGLAPGTYTVRVTFLGFEPMEQEVTLEAGEDRRLDVELSPATTEVDEVVVEAERDAAEARAIGANRVETALIKQLPAVLEPDLFRSLQLLPGVKAASDFSSGLYIRGGSPDQTLILLDRTTVYNPTHFFGLFSTFNPDAIKDVQLYKGGYPAEYGGRLGSVVDIYNKDGNRRETQGGFSVGLLASRAYVEGPYGRSWGDDGEERGSYMVALRRSTLEPLLAVLRSQDVDGIPDGFFFYDLNAKINLDATPNDKLSLAVYGGQDVLDLQFLDDGRFDISYGNRTASLDWQHLLSETVFTNLTLTGSRYLSTPIATISSTRFSQRNEVTDVSLKGDIEWVPTRAHTLKGGIWAGALSFGLRNTFDGVETFEQELSSGYASAYIQDTYRPHDDWQVRAGLRSSYFDRGQYWRLEPRVSVDYTVAEGVRLQTAYGRYHQYLTLETSELFTGFDSWLTTDDGVPPSYGDQFVVGVKTEPWTGWSVDVEGYYRTMRDLFELDPFLPDRAGLPYAETFRFGDGFAFGGEVLVQRSTGAVNGFVGYTLSRTARRFPLVNVGPNGPLYYAPKFDRTHDLNIVANYDLTEKWRMTAAFNYATGQPYTEPTYRFSTVNDPFISDSQTRETFISPFNGERLPAYHRLDVGATRRGTWFGADFELQLQVINLYGRSNIWFYFFETNDDGTVERTEVPQIPVPLPNISFTMTF